MDQSFGTPENPQNAKEYIISAGPEDQTPKVNWIKPALLAIGALVIFGGTGSAIYMIRSTTDSLTKASEKQTKQIQQILDEADAGSSLSLVQNVQAGYEDPFEPTVQESNPFADTTNPFDQVGL